MKKLSTFLMILAFIFGFSQPTTNAPTPTKSASDVISIFSDAYTNVATNYNPNWGQSGAVNPTLVVAAGNNILAYTNFNYQGTDLNTQNAVGMEYLHLDVWVDAGNTRMLKVSPINNGTGAGEFLVQVPLTPGAWNSVDLPKSAFTGMTWDSVFQFKFDGQFNADGSANTSGWNVYLDNIYFWKTSTSAGSDATLSDLKVDGTTISGFNSAANSYNYGVPGGTTTVPQITAATTTDSNATIVSTTQATTIPGTATVVVKSANGNVTNTYSVNYFYSSPAGPAPTPTPLATNVISIYSDSYTNVGSNLNPNWGQGTVVSEVQISGNNTLKYATLNYQGTELSSPINVSSMIYLHIDYWTSNSSALDVFLINSGAVTGGGAVQKNFTLAVPTSGWKSVDIPLTNFSAKSPLGVDLTKIDQMMFTGNGTIYLDNIYFSTEKMAVSDVSKNSVKIYPNPANQGEMVTITDKVKNIEVYNVNGQKVKTSAQNNFSTQGLTKGLYIIKVTSENGVKTSKLIVK